MSTEQKEALTWEALSKDKQEKKEKRRGKKTLADVAEKEETAGFTQFSFFGDAQSGTVSSGNGDANAGATILDTKRKKEITVENLRLLSDPEIQSTTTITNGRRFSRREWIVSAETEPDIWHTRVHRLQLHAQGNAKNAEKLNLHAGDIVDIQGVFWRQRVLMGDGSTRFARHMNVIDIRVVRKVPLKG